MTTLIVTANLAMSSVNEVLVKSIVTSHTIMHNFGTSFFRERLVKVNAIALTGLTDD